MNDIKMQLGSANISGPWKTEKLISDGNRTECSTIQGVIGLVRCNFRVISCRTIQGWSSLLFQISLAGFKSLTQLLPELCYTQSF